MNPHDTARVRVTTKDNEVVIDMPAERAARWVERMMAEEVADDTRDAAQIRPLGELHAWEAKHGASVDTSGMDTGPMATDLWGGVAQSATIAEGMKNPDRWLHYDVDGFLAGHRALLYEAKRDGRTADAESLVQRLLDLADRARTPEMAYRLRRHAETSAVFLGPREAIDPDDAAAEMADALLHPWQTPGRKP